LPTLWIFRAFVLLLTDTFQKWRSPEEYFDLNLNEKVDVYSIANNIYSVLTGLWVFYDEPDNNRVKARIKRGETAYIDPRYKVSSREEAALAEIVEKCHAFNPDDRPSIFEVVAFLRQALKDVSEVEDSRRSSLRASNRR
jgi:serine/threonine protein kinase